MFKVEKRLPFGFLGDWGRVYKLYLNDETGEDIEYQKNNYIQIESDIQFKNIQNGIDKAISSTQPIINIKNSSENMVLKTTDAYFNDITNSYECIVFEGDIIFLFGQFWLVEKIEERNIFTPNKQSFYYCGVKNVSKDIIRRRYVKD